MDGKEKNFSNDQKTESLMPIRDLYSSDDTNICELGDDPVLKKKRKENNLGSSQNQNPLKMTGTRLLYLFDISFNPQKEQANVDVSCVEDILEEIFRFMCINENARKNDCNFERNNKDVFTQNLKQFHWLRWMSENDVINFKSFKHKDWTDKRNEYINFIDSETCRENDPYKLYEREKKNIKTVFEIISTVHDNYVDNQCSNKDRMKDIFRLIEQLMPLQAKLRLDAHYTMMLVEPHDMELGRKVPKLSVIEARPDALFATRNKFTTYPSTGKVVINVYDTRNQYSSAAIEETPLNSMDIENSYSAMSCVPKPGKTAYGSLSKEYSKDAFMYLRESVPTDCREYSLLQEMTGQHVFELLCLAEEQKENRKYCQAMTSDSYYPIGIFMKNEYVYFTQLEVNHDMLNSLFSFVKCNAVYDFDIEKKAVVTFSNWCLDLTLANHRVAFIVAMLELLNV